MQECVQRAIEKHLADGASVEEAHDAAMHEDTAAGLPAEPDADEDREDWRESLPAELFVDADDEEGFTEDDEAMDDETADDEAWKGESPDESSEGGGFDSPERHPLQRRATDLLMRLRHALPREEGSSANIGVLMNGAMEISGGLAQALSFDDDDGFAAGLCVVQLKRALRGAAFAQGALFPLKADGLLDEGIFKELYATLKGLQSDIYDELRRRGG